METKVFVRSSAFLLAVENLKGNVTPELVASLRTAYVDMGTLSFRDQKHVDAINECSVSLMKHAASRIPHTFDESADTALDEAGKATDLAKSIANCSMGDGENHKLTPDIDALRVFVDLGVSYRGLLLLGDAEDQAASDDGYAAWEALEANIKECQRHLPAEGDEVEEGDGTVLSDKDMMKQFRTLLHSTQVAMTAYSDAQWAITEQEVTKVRHDLAYYAGGLHEGKSWKEGLPENPTIENIIEVAKQTFFKQKGINATVIKLTKACQDALHRVARDAVTYLVEAEKVEKLTKEMKETMQTADVFLVEAAIVQISKATKTPTITKSPQAVAQEDIMSEKELTNDDLLPGIAAELQRIKNNV